MSASADVRQVDIPTSGKTNERPGTRAVAMHVRMSAYKARVVLDLIRKLKADGRTVMLISHNMRDVVALADRVVIMGAGRKYVDRPLGDLGADDIAHMIMAGNAKAA